MESLESKHQHFVNHNSAERLQLVGISESVPIQRTMGFASFPALRTQERRMNRRDQLGQLFRRRFMRPRMRTDDLSRQNEDVVLIWQNIATLRQQTTSLPS